MTELNRWSDDRLDDLAQVVRSLGEQLTTIVDMRAEMAGLNQKVSDVIQDTHSCVTSLEKLKTDLDNRAKEQAKDRKSDRRYMVATLLTTASIIVAALAIFWG
jgi:regulator of replication initiation timing